MKNTWLYSRGRTSPTRLAAALQQSVAHTGLCLKLACAWIPLVALGGPARSLADLSIEELMNESVTSVSQKEQKLGDVATAISVLSNDDIRRSAATSIPEALRLVPGLAVGSVNSSGWAISSRGFNSLYANKLLVLVDGRAVYTPLFAGVYWDLQQTMLEDVDRIEVIRGPGATVWGANAVNGVVSVATRSARQSQGSFLYGSADTEAAEAGVRYGGQIGPGTYYRAFASKQSRQGHPLPAGRSPEPDWDGAHGGVRVDHYDDADRHVTWQADATRSRLGDDSVKASNINTLGRWTRRWSGRSSVEAQLYFDWTDRDESTGARATVATTDFTLHQTLGLGEYNDLVWGIGYRHIGNKLVGRSAAAEIRDKDFSLQLFTAFLQDEITVVPDKLRFTLGTKIEHNDFTGFEIQPSVRTVFKPTAHQSIWAAVSRAVRTPDVVEGRDAVAIAYGAPFAGPGGMLFLPTLVGSPRLSSESLLAYEVGYRAQLSPRVHLDLAGYYNKYDTLISIGPVERLVPGMPAGRAIIPWTNNLRATTHGGEVTLNVSPRVGWRLAGSYALFIDRFTARPGAASSVQQRASPRHQGMLRSSSDLTKRASLDVQVRSISGVPGAPAYSAADVRFAYQLSEHLELYIFGKNLLDRQHLEQPVDTYGGVSEVPRAIGGGMSWRF